MWFKLAGATFTNNLGTMSDISNAWSVSCTTSGGITKTAGSGMVTKGGTWTGTFTLSEGATFTSATLTPSSAGTVTSTPSGSTVTVKIEKVSANCTLAVVATGGSSSGGDSGGGGGSNPITPPTNGDYDWITTAVTFEVGSTNDDAAGTMGNKTTNANRLRSSEAIKCDAIRITAPVGMWVWYNLFDDDGKLVGTSGSSLSFTNSTGTGTASREILLKNVGATQIWPIFKGNDSGNTPVTDEQKSQIVIETKIVPDSLAITWESGTFDDSTGEKIDNVARLRTSTKIAVPTTATGILFIPTGTFDLWIKTYDTANQAKPTMNGIKGSMYWNTSYDDVYSLTWSQICTNNTRPAYVDFVLKTQSSNLVPNDATNIIINFI